MNTHRLAFVTLILALALAACAPAAAPHAQVQVASGPGGGDGSTTSASADYLANNEAFAAKGVAPGAPAQAPDRLVIKTANLSLVVADPSDAVQRITTLATGMGGFVVSSNTSEASVDSADNKIMQANLTVRVPSTQLDAALAQIRALAIEVKSVNVTGQDVTSEYTDLQSRLRNAEAAETKLQQIMENANKTEDVLSVFNQLVAIREQVEQLKGQIQYFDESASMSAISVDLIPDALSRPIQVGGWQLQGVAKDALEALVRAFQGLATGVIWVALYVLPLVVVIGLPLYALLRLALRWMRRPRVASA